MAIVNTLRTGRELFDLTLGIKCFYAIQPIDEWYQCEQDYQILKQYVSQENQTNT